MTIMGNGNSQTFQMQPTTSRWFQMFRYEVNMLVNDKDPYKVMQIQGTDREDRENSNIGIFKKNGKSE